MKKKILFRSLIGAPIGLTISMIVTIIVSLCTGHGDYYPAPHELTELCKSPVVAVIVQTLCSFLYGAAFGGASVIWETEDWSLLKQTVIHFTVISLSSFPIAFFMYWIPHSVVGAVVYVAIFIAIYMGIWAGKYFSVKAKIKKLNAKLHTESGER